MTDTCARCGSGRIIPSAQIWDQGQHSDGDLAARIDTKPDKLFFKGTVVAKLRARICGDCGLTEIFAESPRDLYEAYLATRTPA